MSELEELEAAQDAIADAKKAIKQVIRHLNGMAKINMDGGHPREANIAALHRDKFKSILAAVGIAHAEGTEALYESWPDWADDIVVRAGHR